MSHENETESDARMTDSEECTALHAQDGEAIAPDAVESSAEAGATSLAIVERNRRNARFSTGPRTPAGKRRSRWNSLKHGLLIREALIPVGQGKEDRAQLLAILKRFRHGLDIRGLAEELLVERLAVIYWLMRRNHIGEIGELRSGLDNVRDRAMAQWFAVFTSDESLEDYSAPYRIQLSNSNSDQRLIDRIERLVREQGYIDSTHLTEFMKETRSMALALVLVKLPRDRKPGETFEPRERKRLLHDLKKTRALLAETAGAASHEEAENMLQHIGAEAAKYNLPGVAAGKIQRREGSLDIQFHRALRELERLQRARGGGPHVWAVIGAGEGEAENCQNHNEPRF